MFSSWVSLLLVVLSGLGHWRDWMLEEEKSARPRRRQVPSSVTLSLAVVVYSVSEYWCPCGCYNAWLDWTMNGGHHPFASMLRAMPFMRLRY